MSSTTAAPPAATAAAPAGRRSTAPRTRLSAAERREDICRAALRVIARRGFAGTTLRDVAAEAGVAHGLLRHHFGGRDALLAAAFDLAVSEQLASFDALPDDPVAALRAYYAPLSREHYLQWIDAWSEAPRSPDLLATLVRHQRECESDVRRILERGIDSGVFTLPMGAAATASTIIAAMDGLAIQQHAMSMIGARAARTRLVAVTESLCGLTPGTLLR